MNNTINGRTPDEIKKLLANYRQYTFSQEQLYADAIAYIHKLENHIGELAEKVAQLDHVTLERDALLEIVKELGECNYCKHNSYCPHTIPDCMNCKDGNCQCYSCGHQSKWQWSGVQESE